MNTDIIKIETLRYILANALQPQQLDAHPWTRSLIVRQACVEMPELQAKSPGQRLVIAISKLFTLTMPATPPRRGKRMDTQWGEFGMLAAEYFAPIVFGEPTPASLREAWGHIDQSILLFVYGKPERVLSDKEKEPYKLVGNEPAIAPNSTLSDWHRNGLERLLEMIIQRESYLTETLSKPAVILRSDRLSPIGNEKGSHRHSSIKWWHITLLFVVVFLVVLVFGGYKARQIYNQAMLVKQDALQIRSLVGSSGFTLDRIKTAGPALTVFSRDLTTLKAESAPFLWAGPFFSWIPVYGGDISSAKDLMDLADSFLACIELSYQAINPILSNTPTGVTPTQLAELLLKYQPQLIEANHEIGLATTARSHIVPSKLTPEIRDLIINDIDPILPKIKDGLSVAEELPRLMGATNEGPKTYLLLVENEDELRPTGGLVTAVGTILLQDGKINSITFEDEDNVTNNPLVDWSKPYPAAPWQLQLYMNSPVLLLRDTSWFTNYPTAALYAETLYSYVKGYSVNGEIAFDQQFLVEVLNTTGPINIDGISYPIDANNVLAYMRSAKSPTKADLANPNWDIKGFIQKLATAIIPELTSGKIKPDALYNMLISALNEHDLLLKFDNPTMTSLLASHRWDGAVHPESGDFLMAVDTNIGFNKTNAVIVENLSYDVDLTSPASPSSTLTIVHKNNAAGIICKQWNKIRLPGEEYYPITDCYWNYLRVYMAKGAKLLNATPQFVPAYWMIIKQDVLAKVDPLNEGIAGVQTFGTLQVVPGGESVVTNFNFSLPTSVIQTVDSLSIYHLLIQKQPGTKAVPVIIRVHLPNNAVIKTTPSGALTQGGNVLIQTNLETDQEVTLAFKNP